MRTTGVLLAISSLPSNQGIGDFGRQAYHFMDALASSGFKIWQILPFHPLGYGNSPYQPYSSFAGDEIYINIDRLADYGLIKQSSVKTYHKFEERVDFEGVRQFKQPYFKKAFREFHKQFICFEKEYEEFLDQAKWLDTFAVFMALKKKNHMRSWIEWPTEEKNWIKQHSFKLATLKNEIEYEKFIQFIFYKQWKEIRSYAIEKGIKIMGDIPFYVGLDSADVWEHQDSFLLDEDGHPQFIAGVPPDYFSETGQRWGNPIYDWKTLRRDNYEFWIKRLSWYEENFDIVRLDHFRGFDTFWKIPADCKTAIEGEWVLGPAEAFFDEVFKRLPNLHLIVEDLGNLRKEVHELRDHYDLYGMRILQFSLDTKELKKKYPKHVLLYVGTHDNDTMAGFYDQLTGNKKAALRRFFHKQGYEERNICDLAMRYCLDTEADYVMFTMQDILGLKYGRMNTPSTIGSPNWEWKMKNIKDFQSRGDELKRWIVKSKRD